MSSAAAAGNLENLFSLKGSNLLWQNDGPEGGTGPLGNRFSSKLSKTLPFMILVLYPMYAINVRRMNRIKATLLLLDVIMNSL